MKCPQCDSENISKVKMVYMAGTSTSGHSGVGLGGTGEGDLGGGVFVGLSQTKSLLAKELAPPEKPSLLLPIIIGVLTFLFFGGAVNASSTRDLGIAVTLWVITAFLGLLLLGSVSYYRERKERYPKELEAWERLWVCLRCGHTFIPIQAEPQ